MNKNIKSKLALASAGAILGVSLLSGTIGFATTKTNNIGTEKAKEIALKDAGLKASNVSFIKVKLDTDDGVQVYDVEFYSGNKEYDYEINAKTGAIREKDFDIENYSIPKNTNKNQNKAQTPKGLISVEKAKEIALKDSGLKASNVSFIKAKLDTDDGVQVYDVEFYSGNKEYDYEINAKTGAIREKDFDIENYSIPKNTNKNQNTQSQNGLIGIEKAKEIALSSSGVNRSNARFTKAKLDIDGGIQVYDIEFKVGTTEYNYEIEAKTGNIVESDVNHDD